jgi:hypothetical protein
MNVMNAGTQNQLAQMQMQEQQQMAPLRLQEAQARAAASKLTLDDATEARKFVAQVMQKAAEHAEAPKDPLIAARQLLADPRPQVQAVGKQLYDSALLVQNFDAEQRYQESISRPAAAPTAAGAPAQPDMANALAMKIQGLEAQRNQLRPLLKSPSAKADFDALGKQIDKLSEGFSIPAGGARYQPGVGMIERPAAAPAPSELTRLIAERDAAKAKGAAPNVIANYDAAISKQVNFAPPMQVVMPVAVEDPNRPGSVIYVDRKEALGKTPATAIEGLAPKEIQAREAKYPQALQAVKTLDTKTESLAKDIEVLANHPGLTGISGLVYGRTPAVTKDARAAQALYDSIVARGGFAELQNMRAASPTGGALGNISNQEGQYLRDAWAAINRTQDTADLKANLLKAAAQARASKASIKEAFDATYDYRANRGGVAAPATSNGVDSSNPLLK